MGRRLADIEIEIKNHEQKFSSFLRNILEGEIFRLIDQLSKSTKVYLFSGIIRNYFLHKYLVRDVDLVIESDDGLDKVLEGLKYRQNSFGGYKIELDGKNIDIWRMDKTWAFNHRQKHLNLDLQRIIPETSFFNFSAIIYSINEQKFFYTKDFLSFLRTKTIDYVYEPNANRQLCVVNTFYYQKKYDLKVSNKLLHLISSWYWEGEKDYEKVQYKHFGKVIFSNSEILEKVIPTNELLECK
ncbi:hypothetical protein AWW68_13035 [Roseivirga spongicola]|uniref:Poly A polymerase head domain-containing protein n=1 Tax=Roseivirga spongicola TaxID=333140 RepID=A0A150X4G2_9BACT|nr:hypothetical protein [Roseivirga spongicola]KYG73609.1 hypothetical protein AWW68_13035 [Roseivirga spongicola]